MLEADALDSPQALRQWLQAVAPAERSRQVGELSKGEIARFATLLGPTTGAEVLRSINADVAADVLNAVDQRGAARLIEGLDYDVAAEILRRLRPNTRESLIDAVGGEDAETLRGMLRWSPDVVAAHMIPEAFTVESVLTAAEAADAVRAQTPRVRGRARVGASIYVTDADRRLVGMVDFQDLVLAEPDQPVSELMDDDITWVLSTVDAEDAAQSVVDNDLAGLPVIDEQRHLLGVLTSDAALDILEEEATEDAERQGGSQPLEVPYLRASPVLLWRKRIVWLLVLFVGEAYTGTVLRAFEEELDAVVALAFFIPLLIGTGGNTGTQITTTLVRAMATGQARLRDLHRILAKEMTTGVMVALTMAAAAVVRAWTLGVGREVTITVALTVAAIVMWAAFVASVLPPLLKKLRVDPAVVSAPMIATIVDGTGLIIYFVIAHLTLTQLSGL